MYRLPLLALNACDLASVNTSQNVQCNREKKKKKQKTFTFCSVHLAVKMISHPLHKLHFSQKGK